MILNKDRYYPTSTIVKRGVVIHDSESGDGSTANLISLLQRPGDRPSSHGGFYGSGYHAVTDGQGGYIQVADATAGPYSAPPLNATWWHICMPGYAKQTRQEWLDVISMNHIKGVANFVVDKWHEDGQTWPLAFIFADLLLKNYHGYTSHAQVSLAWHQTTHTDPGPNFPWDVLEQEIGKLIQSSEDDMKEVYYCNAEPRPWAGNTYPAKNIKYLLMDNGKARRVSGEELADRGHTNIGLDFGIPKSNAYLDSIGEV